MNKSLRLLVIMVVVLLLTGCQNLFINSADQSQSNPSTPGVNTPNSGIQDVEIPSEWIQVNDPVFGITFSYPPDWNLTLADSLTSETTITSFNPSAAGGSIPGSELKIAIVRINTNHQDQWYSPPNSSEIVEEQPIFIGGKEATWRKVQGMGENIAIVIPVDDLIYVLSAYPADSVYENEWKMFLSSISFKPGLDLVEPTANQVISSPLTIRGSIPGTWFFEGSLPAQLIDEKGNIISSGVMQSEGEWMTEQSVNFSGELHFIRPINMQNGFLVLEKDNPSGLPENARQVKIPVRF